MFVESRLLPLLALAAPVLAHPWDSSNEGRPHPSGAPQPGSWEGSPYGSGESNPWAYNPGGAQSSQSPIGNPYAPIATSCPDIDLVRPADGISDLEERWLRARKWRAGKALSKWLSKHGDFGAFDQPTIAFASSGGGLRAFLEAAGVVQAFDDRDSDYGTSGLYQAFSYQSGISGGSWFVSTLAGNNWPTITWLKENLWHTGFENIVPPDPSAEATTPDYQNVVADTKAKQDAGFTTTLVDPFGLFVRDALISQTTSHAEYVSSIAGLSNFTSFNAPFPIFTSVGSRPESGQCFPESTSPQYEFNPFEFGSWDEGVSAFTPIKYVGSNLTNGEPTNDDSCITQYDALSYAWSSSANIFPKLYCFVDIAQLALPLVQVLIDVVSQAHEALPTDIFAIWPNPFYKYPRATLVQSDPELFLNDGGFVGSDVPIWPFIQHGRDVDVIIANDISEDTEYSFPNGSQLRFTYDRAQATGLTRMPFIPQPDVFVSQGLNVRATFFGCDEPDTAFIIFLPNVAYTFPSNQSSLRTSYSPADTDAMIANGVLIGTQNNEPDWPFCLACGIKNQDGPKLPEGCDACFEKYCFHR